MFKRKVHNRTHCEIGFVQVFAVAKTLPKRTITKLFIIQKTNHMAKYVKKVQNKE